MPLSTQLALLKSSDYREGVELQRVTEGYLTKDEIQNADESYHLAATKILKAAAQNLEADISDCTFRAGMCLNNLSRSDSERAYLLLRYTQVISSKAGLAEVCESVIDKMKKENLLSRKKIEELDKRIERNIVRD